VCQLAAQEAAACVVLFMRQSLTRSVAPLRVVEEDICI